MSRRLRPFRTLLPLAGALLLTGIAPARALVPYVYIPQAPEMQAAGLEIAQMAARLLRLGPANDAARLAELTVQLLPNDPRGWVLLAEAQLRSKAMGKAALALEKAKRLDPGNPGIWFAEGSLALRNGKPDQALSLLRRGLELDGRNAGAYFDLGNANLLLGRPDAALRAFETAVSRLAGQHGRRVRKLQPDVAETNLALAAVLFEGSALDQKEALQLAEKALAAEPNYVLESFQKEQLWGPKLRASTARLLAQPPLKAAVERANANAGSSDGDEP